MSAPRLALAGAAAAFGVLALGGLAASQIALPAHPATAVTVTGMLTRPIPDTEPNADQLRRGQALVQAGDCASCHTRPGGAFMAGSLGLKTPFGTIFTSNLTSDRETGIGGWTPEQFHRALHDGIGRRGGNLYPAFPYPWFRRVSRADTDAILAYLKTTPAVHSTRPANQLPFPLNFRFMVKGWNLLFLHSRDFQPDGSKSAEWNRGAYLVNGLGHCGECHTPKNILGADRSGKDFHGGVVETWVAPDLTGNMRTGLGGWSTDDIAEFLKTGRNARAGAGASMAEVISYSTSLMSDADRHAIAVYLKSLPASPDANPAAPDPAAMSRGAAIYSDACASCHLAGGVGQPRLFPPLGHNALAQQANPTGIEHLILAGNRIAPTAGRPSPLAMPSFAWKLTDQQAADVATYVRNSWGNHAPAVKASGMAKMRRKLGLQTVRYTANSGDQR
jgi:mono/diheme cytochrome c family protein